MKIKRLQLAHYRNYETLDLQFKDGLTILTGENAQGKTNLLEAIFLLSMAKSHRTNLDQELIQWEHDSATIKGEIESKHYDFPLELQLKPQGKVAKYNHLEQPRLSQFVGKFNVILFAPEDLQLVKGSPGIRRRFIDAELAQSHPVYMQELVDYNRLLQQRNRYLKATQRQEQTFDELYFNILTEQLIEKAASVITYRVEFIERLNQTVEEIHLELSNQRDHLQLTYDASSAKLDYQKLDTLKEQLTELFQSSRQRERDQAVTVYGPHRDDLSFYLNGKLAKNFSSQGQQRTIVLSLKLAELELLNDMIGEYPVLLLDDVLSELDDQRQHLLMERIEDKVQTFLTTASIEGIQFERLQQASLFQIDQGTVRPVDLSTLTANKGESVNGRE